MAWLYLTWDRFCIWYRLKLYERDAERYRRLGARLPQHRLAMQNVMLRQTRHKIRFGKLEKAKTEDGEVQEQATALLLRQNQRRTATRVTDRRSTAGRNR